MHARILLLFTLLAALTTSGCAAWNTDKWDLSRYRDPRAADIDQRLGGELPSAENSFGRVSE